MQVRGSSRRGSPPQLGCSSRVRARRPECVCSWIAGCCLSVAVEGWWRGGALGSWCRGGAWRGRSEDASSWWNPSFLFAVLTFWTLRKSTTD